MVFSKLLLWAGPVTSELDAQSDPVDSLSAEQRPWGAAHEHHLGQPTGKTAVKDVKILSN